MKPAPKKEIKRIPHEPPSETPPIPLPEMVQKMAAHEAAFKQARTAAGYKQTTRIQEYNADGSVGGEYSVTNEIRPASETGRRARQLQDSSPTLVYTSFSPDEIAELARVGALMFTPDVMENYDLTYAGKQQVDELNTYTFRIQPKKLDRKNRFFEGVIWADDQDWEIVRIFGHFVSETPTPDDKVFKMFEIYRESVEDKFRFPTFLRSDDTVAIKDGSIRVRLTIRWTDYKLAKP